MSKVCNAAAAGNGVAAAAGVVIGYSWSYIVGEVFESGAVDVVGPGDVYVMVGGADVDPAGVEVRRHDCVILGIRAGGLVDRWDRKSPGASVGVGDRIIQVNSIKGAIGIHAEFRKRLQFCMWLRKVSAPQTTSSLAACRPGSPQVKR